MTLIHPNVAIVTPSICSPFKDFTEPQKSVCVVPKSLVYEAASISCDSNMMALYDTEVSDVAKMNILAFAMDEFGSNSDRAFWVKGMKDSSCSSVQFSGGSWVVNMTSSCTGSAFVFCEFMKDSPSTSKFI